MTRFPQTNEVSQASHDVWWIVGQELEQRGLLNTAEDVFFLSLPELHAALTRETMQQTVQAHRSVYDFELRRRHIPRMLLSDGTEPNAATVASGPSQGIQRGRLRHQASSQQRRS